MKFEITFAAIDINIATKYILEADNGNIIPHMTKFVKLWEST